MSDDSIRIEYHENLQELEECLAGVERPGDFFVQGAVEIPLPKVEVQGVGILSFPVPLPQIDALIQQASRAPYGRGEETILDELVRKVWQLKPEQVMIWGKSWATHFDGVLQRVVAGLGCEGQNVSAELYKLLVYDCGGFFLAHRDTEKVGGMFGTLVLVLPSMHSGGELVIRHGGREVVVDLGSAEMSEIAFAAFYADCEHEVRPITEGNRVCLVYNLIQQPGYRKTLHAPNYDHEIVEVAALLGKNLTESGSPAKIAWLLEHQYSPESLGFAGLKSDDAARVQVLLAAAKRADCVAYLGILHIEESGMAEENYHSYSSRRRSRYYDDEDEDKDEGSDFEVVEVCDWNHFINQWRDAEDHSVEFGDIPLEPGELLPDGGLDGDKPDSQRLLEASGNEGASFERSYHRAALVIWRRNRHIDVLLQAGVESVLPYLAECILRAKGKTAPDPAGEHALKIARRLVEVWSASPDTGYGLKSRPEKRDEMLSLLVKLGDTGLMEKFIMQAVLQDYNGSENEALVAASELLGGHKIGSLIVTLIGEKMWFLHNQCAALLRQLVAARTSASASVWQKPLREIATIAVAKLIEIENPLIVHKPVDWRIRDVTNPVDAGFVVALLDVLGDLKAEVLRFAAAEKFSARPKVFDPLTVLVPALGMLHEWDAAATLLWEHCAKFLLERSSLPPAAPTDWCQETQIACSCQDCRELGRFTRDPVEQVYRFRVRKDRRQHLHNTIEKHSLDMTHVTERLGSPQTLVCTKDRRGYQMRCLQYRKDIAAMAEIQKLRDGSCQAGDLTKQIETARALAAKWSPI